MSWHFRLGHSRPALLWSISSRKLLSRNHLVCNIYRNIYCSVLKCQPLENTYYLMYFPNKHAYIEHSKHQKLNYIPFEKEGWVCNVIDKKYFAQTEVLKMICVVSFWCVCSDISMNFTLSIYFLQNMHLSKWYNSSSCGKACVAIILILQWEEV